MAEKRLSSRPLERRSESLGHEALTCNTLQTLADRVTSAADQMSPGFRRSTEDGPNRKYGIAAWINGI